MTLGAAIREVAPEPRSAQPPQSQAASWALLAAGAMAAFYLATSIYIGAHRLYWFDELFIVRFAQMPSVATMWDALAHASDTMPPGYHLVMRGVTRVIGFSEVATRLPSALAMIVGLLIVFDCTRRLTDALHGLMAMALLSCSLLPYYGYEARPYALFFMLSALALWIWTTTRRDSRAAAVAFAATLGVAVTMHYYAVLNLVPYAIFYLLRWRTCRRPSPMLTAGIIGVVLPAVALAPLGMAYSHQFSHGFWAHPSLYQLKQVFPEMFPDGFFLLAIMVVWVCLALPRQQSGPPTEMQDAELLGWLFLCIPLAGFVVAELRTNAFLPRYFIGALPGIAVAFACWMWRHFHRAQRVSAGVVALLALWGATNQMMVVRHPESVDPFGQQTATREYLKLESAIDSDGKRYILFHDSLLHLEAKHYSRHPGEVYLLLGPGGQPETPTERVQVNLSHYSPMQFWSVDDLKRHAHETAVVDAAPEMVDAMKQAGFRPMVRFPEPVEVVYFQ